MVICLRAHENGGKNDRRKKNCQDDKEVAERGGREAIAGRAVKPLR